MASRVKVEWQRRLLGSPVLQFLYRWVVTTVAVLVAANLVGGIRYDTWVSLVLASLLLGGLNALVRPLLVILSLPLVVLSLGLFVLVINGVLLLLVAVVVPGFHVEGFWAALFGAVLISITTLVLNTLTGGGQTRIDLRHPGPRGPRRDGDRSGPPGQGPVIDV
jgi:putative membrane protein